MVAVLSVMFHICHIATFSFFASYILHAINVRNTQHMMQQTIHKCIPSSKTNLTPPSNTNANISYFSHFGKYQLFIAFCRYVCDMCVSYLYFIPFLGICASVRPPPTICSSMTTLPILKFYIIFFSDFFYFYFFYLDYCLVYWYYPQFTLYFAPQSHECLFVYN